MAEERVQRRLAAILAADVVGYSKLTNADEAGTRVRFNHQFNKVIRPAIGDYHGRLVKTMGDGFLVEFGSVVDAVQSAADIQNGVASQQDGEPDATKMLFRIGIHIGDVIVEDEDIHGDGVNIASRLEGLAEPGGICISGMVHEGVRNKLSLDFDALGEQSLKNIADPVQVFRVVLNTPSAEWVKTTDALFRRPAVAVLPFENISGDSEQEYFADGLTEDLITALSMWRSFPVIARSSTFSYKGKSPDIRRIGEELGVRYVVEGSVRKAGNRVRVTAQLINADTGHHVWAERFDRDLEDIFNLQDELTVRVATTIVPELEQAERQRSIGRKSSQLDVWDYFLRGMSLLYQYTANNNSAALALFEKAVALDPSYARARTGIAYCHYNDAWLGFSDNRQDSVAKCISAAEYATTLDGTDFLAYFVLSRGLNIAGKSDEAELAANKAIELNPLSAQAHASLGLILMSSDQFDGGISEIERAVKLSPRDHSSHIFYEVLSCGHLASERYAEAAAMAKCAVALRPRDSHARVLYVSNLGLAGHCDDALTAFADGEGIGCDDLKNLWMLPFFSPVRRSQIEGRIVAGLRKAGWEG